MSSDFHSDMDENPENGLHVFDDLQQEMEVDPFDANFPNSSNLIDHNISYIPQSDIVLNDDDIPPQEIYCYCRKPESGFMIYCESCAEWYHGTCVAIDRNLGEQLPRYICHRCRGIGILENLQLCKNELAETLTKSKSPSKAQKKSPVPKASPASPASVSIKKSASVSASSKSDKPSPPYSKPSNETSVRNISNNTSSPEQNPRKRPNEETMEQVPVPAKKHKLNELGKTSNKIVTDKNRLTFRKAIKEVIEGVVKSKEYEGAIGEVDKIYGIFSNRDKSKPKDFSDSGISNTIQKVDDDHKDKLNSPSNQKDQEKKVSEVLPIAVPDSGLVLRLSEEIEVAWFEKCNRKIDTNYTEQLRMLRYNLRSNPALIVRLVVGQITAFDLANFSAEEMASEKQKALLKELQMEDELARNRTKEKEEKERDKEEFIISTGRIHDRAVVASLPSFVDDINKSSEMIMHEEDQETSKIASALETSSASIIMASGAPVSTISVPPISSATSSLALISDSIISSSATSTLSNPNLLVSPLSGHEQSSLIPTLSSSSTLLKDALLNPSMIVRPQINLDDDDETFEITEIPEEPEPSNGVDSQQKSSQPAKLTSHMGDNQSSHGAGGGGVQLILKEISLESRELEQAGSNLATIQYDPAAPILDDIDNSNNNLPSNRHHTSDLARYPLVWSGLITYRGATPDTLSNLRNIHGMNIEPILRYWKVNSFDMAQRVDLTKILDYLAQIEMPSSNRCLCVQLMEPQTPEHDSTFVGLYNHLQSINRAGVVTIKGNLLDLGAFKEIYVLPIPTSYSRPLPYIPLDLLSKLTNRLFLIIICEKKALESAMATAKSDKPVFISPIHSTPSPSTSSTSSVLGSSGGGQHPTSAGIPKNSILGPGIHSAVPTAASTINPILGNYPAPSANPFVTGTAAAASLAKLQANLLPIFGGVMPHQLPPPSYHPNQQPVSHPHEMPPYHPSGSSSVPPSMGNPNFSRHGSHPNYQSSMQQQGYPMAQNQPPSTYGLSPFDRERAKQHQHHPQQSSYPLSQQPNPYLPSSRGVPSNVGNYHMTSNVSFIATPQSSITSQQSATASSNPTPLLDPNKKPSSDLSDFDMVGELLASVANQSGHKPNS